MHEELLGEPLVQMDETYLQVLKNEKAPTSDHYMVVRAASGKCVTHRGGARGARERCALKRAAYPS